MCSFSHVNDEKVRFFSFCLRSRGYTARKSQIANHFIRECGKVGNSAHRHNMRLKNPLPNNHSLLGSMKEQRITSYTSSFFSIIETAIG